jgi:hypothetical protein
VVSFKVGDVVEVQHPTWDNWDVTFSVVATYDGHGNFGFVRIHPRMAQRDYWSWNERTSEARIRKAIASFVGFIPCPSR